MAELALVRDAGVERALARLRDAPLNFDPRGLWAPDAGWRLDERLQPLPAEEPGDPAPDGPFEIARRLMRGYEFADPSMVRAYYDAGAPLEGRDMLLEVRFHGLRIRVGCRVGEVYERTETVAGREARVRGWSYRTLRGHFEQGEMHWQVLKWTGSGEVAFRLRACSRRSSDPSLPVRIGFRLFGRREQLRFYDSTCERMRRLTEEALARGPSREVVREVAAAATARSARGDEPVHEALARNVERDGD